MGCREHAFQGSLVTRHGLLVTIPLKIICFFAMAYPSGIIRTEKGKHRLHEPIFILSAVCASISTALASKIINGRFPKFEVIGYMCNQFDRCVVFPFAGPIEEMLTNTIPDFLEFRIDEQPRGADRNLGEWPQETMWTKVILPFFVQFFEDRRPWLAVNINNQFTQWPNVWQFARIVRNAAAHGGQVNIDDLSFVPVTWHTLTYGPDQNGRKIFGEDLSLADVFILMLEMNNSLNVLSCPI